MNGKGLKLDIKTIYRKYGILAIMIALIIIASFLDSSFLKPANLINILKQITPFAIIACGETMLIVSGHIDLSAGWVAAMAGCVSATVLISTDSLFLCVLAGMVVGAVMNYIAGSLITTLKLPAFIATLATMNIAKGFSYVYTGGETISGLEKLRGLSQGRLGGVIPYMILVLVCLLILIQIVMKNTRFGLYMYAVGGNDKAAIAAGVNVNRQVRMTYVLHGVLVGIAGVVLNARMMAAIANVGASSYEFDAITATVLGGTSFSGGFGSMYNVVIGSVILGIINNIMILMGLDANWQIIVKGLLIAGAVALDIATKSSKK